MKKKVAVGLLGGGSLIMVMFSGPSWLMVRDALSATNWYVFGFGLVVCLLGLYLLIDSREQYSPPNVYVCSNCGLQIEVIGDIIPDCENCQIQMISKPLNHGNHKENHQGSHLNY